MPLRIIFMGTPDFSVPTLEAIVEAGHEVVAVQKAAERLGIEVRSPTTLRDGAAQQEFAALDADLAVVVAYGLLLPPQVLRATRLGAYNGHASLLPRWRGAAPIQRAIMAGDAETGMMIMKMEEGLDTGPVGLAQRIAIGPDETAGELHDRLMHAGARLMVEALRKLEAGDLPLTPQVPEGATYARKIDKAETRIDWNLPASEVHNRVRGLSPFPGAWCEIELGGRRERLKILRTTIGKGSGPAGAVLNDRLNVGCGEGAVRLVELQRAGGKPVKADEFLRGAKIDQEPRLL